MRNMVNYIPVQLEQKQSVYDTGLQTQVSQDIVSLIISN